MSVGTTNYTYDAENRMVSVSGAASATFVYDGDGNRVKGVVGGVTTTYIGNYFEWSGSTSTMKKYYYAGGTRVAERVGTLSTSYYFLLTDHLGSTSITATRTGGFSSELRYKAWGETRYSSGSTPTTFRYTGQREESSLGLYWYNSRWYSASLSRFLSPDTIIPNPNNPLDWDRYSYVRNNPVIFTDPTGHFTDSELAQLMGYKSLEEMYMSDWWKEALNTEGILDLLHEAQMGDIVEFSFNNDKDTIFKMMFCENKKGQLSFWLLDYKMEVSAEKGLGGLSLANNWALFTRDDKRFFDKYNPSWTNHKGEYLPEPEIGNNIGIWGGAVDNKPGDVRWEEKMNWNALIASYGEFFVGLVSSIGTATTGQWWGLPPAILLLHQGVTDVFEQDYLLERTPTIR